MLAVGGRRAIPIPHFAAFPLARLLWTAGIGDTHPSYMNYLRFSVVLDGSKARAELGFEPRTTAEAVEQFYREVGQ